MNIFLIELLARDEVTDSDSLVQESIDPGMTEHTSCRFLPGHSSCVISGTLEAPINSASTA